MQELRRDLEEETRRAEKREQAEAKAAAYYELMRKKDYTRVVEGYDQIQNEQLSKAEAEVFRDTEERFRIAALGQRVPVRPRSDAHRPLRGGGRVLSGRDALEGRGHAHARR